jgi:purine-nucleoside phosphorylase
MYHETTRATLTALFKLPADYEMDAGIILGRWHPHEPMQRWRAYLSDVHEPSHTWHNAMFGTYQSTRIGYAVVYGATMAADVARAWHILGAKKLIQIGYYGGLQAGMQRGDFIVPSEGIRMDGASDAYLHPEVRVHATEALHAEAIAQLRRTPDTTVHLLPQLTIVGGILSETREQISAWSARGYGGVDLETAATFAVAQRFGMACAAMLICSDVIVEGDSLFHRTEGEVRDRYKRAELLMEDVALRIA